MDNYVRRLVELIGLPGVKFITGVRFGGKTTLLKMFASELPKLGFAPENIFYIDCDAPPDDDDAILAAHHAEVVSRLSQGQDVFLLADELSSAREFETLAGNLYLNRKLHFYIATSWRGLITQELTTVVSGGYREVRVLPAIHVAGFERERIIGRLYTILYKDVLRHHALRDVNFLFDLLRYVYRCGRETLTYRRMMRELRPTNAPPHQKTLVEYLTALKEAGLAEELPRGDLTDRMRVLTGANKWYATEPGLRRAVLGDADSLAARWENAVYLELQRRGYEFLAGSGRRGDITFVSPGNPGFYVQLTTMSQLKSALKPLRAIQTDVPKFVLTAEDIVARYAYGVKIMSARQFAENGGELKNT